MPTLVTQAVGVFGLGLGVAWALWPLRMVALQYRVLYFWSEPPDVEERTNETLARVSGLFLAALGGALLVGILP